jgi:hypothetical protein
LDCTVFGGDCRASEVGMLRDEEWRYMSIFDFKAFGLVGLKI